MGGDFVRIDEEIPGSYYREFGEGKYIGLPAAGIQRVVLKGLGAGTFTFEASEVVADCDIHTVSYKNIPTSSSTVDILQIDANNVASTSPSLDLNGDGAVDMTLAQGEGVTLHELLAILKGIVKTLDLPKEKEYRLLKRIEKIEKEIAKEHKNKKAEEHKTKDVFKQLLKTVDKYEEKHVLTTDEADELRIIIEQIMAGVIK